MALANEPAGLHSAVQQKFEEPASGTHPELDPILTVSLARAMAHDVVQLWRGRRPLNVRAALDEQMRTEWPAPAKFHEPAFLDDVATELTKLYER